MAKYNQTIIDKIKEKLENGQTRKDAGNLCGISDTTFQMWLKKPAFRVLVELAETVYIEKMIKIVNVKTIAETSGRLALEVLSRRRPNEWGEKKSLEIEGTVNIIIDQVLKK